MARFTHDEFTALIREHQAGLRAFLCSLGVAFDWIDDIAQEAFVLAYRKQAEFDPDTNFGAWLRAIARHLVLNEATKRQRRTRLLDARVSDLLDQHGDPLLNPSEQAGLADSHAQRLQALGTCLDGLTERARAVILSRYHRNLTSDEIGRECALSASAVRKILFHSRHLLARCIEQELARAHP